MYRIESLTELLTKVQQQSKTIAESPDLIEQVRDLASKWSDYKTKATQDEKDALRWLKQITGISKKRRLTKKALAQAFVKLKLRKTINPEKLLETLSADFKSYGEDMVKEKLHDMLDKARENSSMLFKPHKVLLMHECGVLLYLKQSLKGLKKERISDTTKTFIETWVDEIDYCMEHCWAYIVINANPTWKTLQGHRSERRAQDEEKIKGKVGNLLKESHWLSQYYTEAVVRDLKANYTQIPRDDFCDVINNDGPFASFKHCMNIWTRTSTTQCVPTRVGFSTGVIRELYDLFIILISYDDEGLPQF